jgi:excisionase family DNA binding protein
VRDFRDSDLVLTVEEAAKVLRIGRNAAYEAVKCGTIPHVRFGRNIRVPRAELMRLVGRDAFSRIDLDDD